MRATRFHLHTTRETPAEAEIASHRLVLRAGLVRPLAAGIYIWTPLGLRVLRKVADLVREEMDAAGALEVAMPLVQPADLWQSSGRWDQYGADLTRLQDRRGRDFCLGPTHEEVITTLAIEELRSHRQFPVNFYQIGTKFRDEPRPRFGLLRCREFVMKDAYSFHLEAETLQQTYDAMGRAYENILDRVGITYRKVAADTGSIGGSSSHEFQALCESGEDLIAVSEGGDYAANLELAAPAPPQEEEPPAPAMQLQEVATPGVTTIAKLASFLGEPEKRGVKTLFAAGAETPLVALVLRGDHELNPLAAEKHPAVASPFRMAEEAQVRDALGAGFGSLGPVQMPQGIPVLADLDAAVLADFTAGANRDGWHLRGINWGRDCDYTDRLCLRLVREGDPSPAGDGPLRLVRGIEVGHIFQLGEKYSKSMGLQVQDEKGAATTPLMGCYGFGVSRLVAAIIEQHHDEQGIVWPQAVAPFQTCLVTLGGRSGGERVMQAAERLYAEMQAAGLEVLWDDRDERVGVKMADAELLGHPHLLVLGERGLDRGQVEYRNRGGHLEEDWPLDGAAKRLRELLDAAKG